jgi:hypothetical protein
MTLPVLYVSIAGDVRPFVMEPRTISVGPVLSRIGERLFFTATLTIDEIKALGPDRRRYNQLQIGKGWGHGWPHFVPQGNPQ